MINIVSTQANQKAITGPKKVFENLIKGLDKCGYPYVINGSPDSTNRLWVHDNHEVFKQIGNYNVQKLVGPNLYTMPEEIMGEVAFDNTQYIQPCEWVKVLWRNAGFIDCPIRVWPVGIDTNYFYPSNNKLLSKSVLIYHKKRSEKELVDLMGLLDELHLDYKLINYPCYKEKDYRRKLKRTSFIIWHGNHESQGIALLEAMTCNVPILVWDTTRDWAVNIIKQIVPGILESCFKGVQVTTAPYFDSRCGIKIGNYSEMKQAIEFMQENLKDFSPREYILDNLTLEQQAERFVSLWN